MPETRIDTGFRHFSPLFKLNRSWWLTREIIEYAVHSLDLIDDSAHHGLEYLEWNLSCIGGHEIDGAHCTHGNGIIIGTLITHDSYASHIGQSGKILVRHPGWFLAVCFLVLFCCFFDFASVDPVGILYDADLLGSNFTDDSDSKSRAREWLAVYKVIRKAKL